MRLYVIRHGDAAHSPYTYGVVKPLTDYKKQRIPAGLYTLRLAIQPQDGDHMGTAPYNEFCLFCPAAEDKKPDPLTVKDLRELSTKSTDNHPGVFVLFPAEGHRSTQGSLARIGAPSAAD